MAGSPKKLRDLLQEMYDKYKHDEDMHSGSSYRSLDRFEERCFPEMIHYIWGKNADYEKEVEYDDKIKFAYIVDNIHINPRTKDIFDIDEEPVITSNFRPDGINMLRGRDASHDAKYKAGSISEMYNKVIIYTHLHQTQVYFGGNCILSYMNKHMSEDDAKKLINISHSQVESLGDQQTFDSY